ncbi:epsin-3 isoform X2 [Eucyclogobius newberryi]|uniref:epsin-3 isoform X2 n=1 Tax=Eucyclogobius newberryi TaxID=166745 RepID=UPI003B5C95EC
MQSSSLRRQMKNVVNNYTEAEIKVREATSNDPWGPPTSLMAEISNLTFNVVAIAEVMGMLWKRLNDHGKNWRHVYKALTLMDYLVKTGSEQVAKECKEKIYSVQTLRDFQYLDRDGRDQGINVREKAKRLVSLLKDEEKLKKERSLALKTKTRMSGASGGLVSMPPPYTGRQASHQDAGAYGDEQGRCRRTSSSLPSSTAASRLAPDIEQARPQTTGEEELQLQLALAMSREETEKPPPPTVDIDEQTQLQIAMSLSKEDSKKPAPRAPTKKNVTMDEDSQLQLALNLSKEEHQQEQLSRQGDESMLLKALEESKREMETKGGTAFMDLVDIFAVSSDAPPQDRHSSLHQAAARGGGRDPWDSLDEGTNLSRPDSPWMAPPSSPPPPWEPYQASVAPWDAPLNNVPASSSSTWASSGRADQMKGAGRVPSPRMGSPSDGDLFDEAMDGGKISINGRGDACSPELFDMTNLMENLPPAYNARTCRTPESFLDPAAASLVNLDTLIPVNSDLKNKNPFLSGLSAPSANNPFQTEQPKLTLNQMGSGLISTAPNNASLPYSASLPLPSSHQTASLPSSLTHPTQQGLDLLGTMPEPLLPLSGSTQGAQASQASQNPFL